MGVFLREVFRIVYRSFGFLWDWREKVVVVEEIGIISLYFVND